MTIYDTYIVPSSWLQRATGPRSFAKEVKKKGVQSQNWAGNLSLQEFKGTSKWSSLHFAFRKRWAPLTKRLLQQCLLSAAVFVFCRKPHWWSLITGSALVQIFFTLEEVPTPSVCGRVPWTYLSISFNVDNVDIHTIDFTYLNIGGWRLQDGSSVFKVLYPCPYGGFNPMVTSSTDRRARPCCMIYLVWV